MMNLLGNGKIYLVKEPVSGRFGLPRLLAMLSQNTFNVRWNGMDEITVITFNRRRTRCSILHCDFAGIDRTVRQLNSGVFKVLLDDGLLPERITKEKLIRLLLDGTLEGEFVNAEVKYYLQNNKK